MHKSLHSSLFFTCVFFLFTPFFAFAADYSSERAGAWNTYKELYIDGYEAYPAAGLVFSPTSCGERSQDACDYAVSEGVGYGLLLAAIQDDQDTFDRILAAAEKWMWTGSTYRWKVGTSGEQLGKNGATDADEDIAFSLILADLKQQKGTWRQNSTYGKRAQQLIDTLYEKNTIDGYLKPGAVFGGPDELNLSYFSPAYYRVFDWYETTDHDWQRVINVQYAVLATVSERYNGIIPDWCDAEGNPVEDRSSDMRYDAIRVPWRIALDGLWFGEERAHAYLNTILPRVLELSGVEESRMYTLDGTPIEYHNELTTAMWAVGAFGMTQLDPQTQQAFIDEWYSFYNPTDQSFNAQRETAKWSYYKQSLALLAAVTLDGSFSAPRTVDTTDIHSDSEPSSSISTPPNESEEVSQPTQSHTSKDKKQRRVRRVATQRFFSKICRSNNSACVFFTPSLLFRL